MTFNPQATDFMTILEAIAARVVSVTGVDEHYVRLSASDEYKYDYERSLVVIRPLGPQPFTEAGGGRGARIERRIIRVYCNIRNSSDQVGKDNIALEALFDLENLVNDGLDEFYPSNISGSLTIEPLHPVEGGNSPPFREANNDIGEVFSVLNFEVVFVRHNSIPAPS